MMSLDANTGAVCRPAARCLMTASQLRTAGRGVPQSFVVELSQSGEGHAGEPLEIVEPLRVLPGRRIVARALWRGQTVLAKLFLGPASEENQRAATLEAEGLRAMQSASVPAPAVILSAGFAAGGQVLMLEFLESSHTLAQVWSDSPARRTPMLAQLENLFLLLGRLHAAGFGHDDLHLGNVLLAEGQAYLIDGDAVRAFPFDASARAAAQLANLALCCVQLPLWTLPAWPALLAAYAAGGAALPANGALEIAVRAARARRLRHFMSKTGRDCTQFSIERRLTCVTACVRAWRELLAPALRAPDDWVARGAMLKDGGTCTVVRVAAGDIDCVVKRYNLKGVRHALSRAWRPSRAWHSWRAGHLLQHLGIATPEPLAVLEERLGPLRRRAFLVTRHCPGRPLLEHLEAEREPSPAEATALLEFFQAMHGMRIEHGDFKATNLLWHDEQIWVIDLDAMHRHASKRTYVRAWRRDRRRFLANWPEGSPLRRWLEVNLPGVD